MRYHTLLFQEIRELETSLFDEVSAPIMQFSRWSTTVKLFDRNGIAEFIISMAVLVIWVILSINYIIANTDTDLFNGVLILMMLVPLTLILYYVLKSEFSPIKEKTEE
jgi:hypothetical protein